MIFIIPIILFVILTMILPQLMIYVFLGVIGYVLGWALHKKQLGVLVIMLCIFSSLSLLAEKVTPLVEKSEKDTVKNKTEILNKQFTFEEEKDDAWYKIWDYVTKSKEKGDK